MTRNQQPQKNVGPSGPRVSLVRTAGGVVPPANEQEMVFCFGGKAMLRQMAVWLGCFVGAGLFILPATPVGVAGGKAVRLTGCGEESEPRPWIGPAPGAVRPWPSERDLSTRQRSFQPK